MTQTKTIKVAKVGRAKRKCKMRKREVKSIFERITYGIFVPRERSFSEFYDEQLKYWRER